VRQTGFVLFFIVIIIALVGMVVAYYFVAKKGNIPVNNSVKVQNDSISRCLDEVGDKVSMDFKNCKPCKDVKYVGFGSTHLELIGLLDGKCQMNWGSETENPNWDGKLNNHCLIPSSMGTLEFNVTNYGVDFSSISKYCELVE
jgi:hypothetical protein